VLVLLLWWFGPLMVLVLSFTVNSTTTTTNTNSHVHPPQPKDDDAIVWSLVDWLVKTHGMVSNKLDFRSNVIVPQIINDVCWEDWKLFATNEILANEIIMDIPFSSMVSSKKCYTSTKTATSIPPPVTVSREQRECQTIQNMVDEYQKGTKQQQQDPNSSTLYSSKYYPYMKYIFEGGGDGNGGKNCKHRSIMPISIWSEQGKHLLLDIVIGEELQPRHDFVEQFFYQHQCGDEELTTTLKLMVMTLIIIIIIIIIMTLFNMITHHQSPPSPSWRATMTTNNNHKTSTTTTTTTTTTKTMIQVYARRTIAPVNNCIHILVFCRIVLDGGYWNVIQIPKVWI
jgi:hypothetical protein